MPVMSICNHGAGLAVGLPARAQSPAPSRGADEAAGKPASVLRIALATPGTCPSIQTAAFTAAMNTIMVTMGEQRRPNRIGTAAADYDDDQHLERDCDSIGVKIRR